MTDNVDKWAWELIDPARSASSGDVAKIFKNEKVRQPSLFDRGAPSVAATILAREVIQNSWDAARELRSADHIDDDDEPFTIEFRFSTARGVDARDIRSALGVGELEARAGGLDRRAVGLGEHDCLNTRADDDSLPMLVISEQRTTGMYGSWSSARSKLYLALLSQGFTVKDEGSGGSYGFGKAGLIGGSLTRTVVAYTCFRERPEDLGVTRRLLGVTYWGQHSFDGSAYSGFARFGARSPSGDVVPFEDDVADEVAQRLGLQARDPNLFEDLGTTFLLLDPAVTPGDTTEAVERNWWPAIIEGAFDVDVVSDEGLMIPRPRSNELLRPFIRGWELANTPQDNVVADEWARQFKGVTLADGSRADVGQIGLVADPEGWSFPLTLGDSPEDSVDHRSLVALVRGPLMVVDYLDSGRNAPFVRGVFAASGDVDDLLRQTEPKAHDAWETDVSVLGVDPDAPRVAKTILDRIRRNVREFRERLKPSVPVRREVQLVELDRLMGQVLGGSSRRNRAARPDNPPAEIELLQQAVIADEHSSMRIRTVADIAVRLERHDDRQSRRAAVALRANIYEDGRVGAPIGLRIEPAGGFRATEDDAHRYVGDLTSEWSTFHIESDAYRSDWTCRILADVDLDFGEAVAPGVAGSS